MNVFVAYLVVAGGVTAGIQVGRGVVRGAGKLIDGEPKAALREVGAGLVAPVRSACDQVRSLGDDVWATAGQAVRKLNAPGV